MNFEIVNIHTHSPLEGEITPRCWGIHPCDAEGATLPDTLPDGIEAVGEIGLDTKHNVPLEPQLRLFEEQLNLAQRFGLPVVLHCVGAFERVMQTLCNYKLRAVIFHGFIGSEQQAAQALNRGYYLSFGERTLRSPKSQKAMQNTPLDRLFVETDVSDIPIAEIYFRLSELKGCSTEDLIESTRNNFRTIFGR